MEGEGAPEPVAANLEGEASHSYSDEKWVQALGVWQPPACQPSREQPRARAGETTRVILYMLLDLFVQVVLIILACT